MNYLERNRRAARRTNAPRRKPGIGGVPLAIWAAALAALLVSVLLLVRARSQYRELVSEREAAAENYAQRVARHTVNGTRPWIERYALENGIEPAFAAAIILRESAYNPAATSPLNARGLMQIMEDTFESIRKGLGDSGTTFADMYDAETNIRYGCWYLGTLSRKYDGDPIKIAAAYNAGPRNVDRWILENDPEGERLRLEDIAFNDTRDYAGKVYDAYSIYYQHFYPDPV